MLIERDLRATLLDALQGFPVVYVNGPRQAGKSTLVQELAENEWPAHYITFDQATQMGAADANPESFLRAFDDRLILDEVQMVPALFRVLKLLVDEARIADKETANGKFLLTGSANIMALPTLSDALVGRMRVLTLYPISALELNGGTDTFLPMLMTNSFKPATLKREPNLVETIRRASFPEIMDQHDEQRRQWFESYITTILQRDVRQIADIEKLGVLPNLLRVLAARAGGLVNEAEISRTIGQNAVTAKNYRILLQMMFLTFDVKAWHRNIGKRLVKSPKSYLIDTALLCHLQQIDMSHAEKNDPHIFGHIFENFVATELLKQRVTSAVNAELFHFRSSDGIEVDFVLEQPDGKLAGIEVKARDAVSVSDFKGLNVLRDQVGEDFVSGVVLYRGHQVIPFAENLWAVPVQRLWMSGSEEPTSATEDVMDRRDQLNDQHRDPL